MNLEGIGGGGVAFSVKLWWGKIYAICLNPPAHWEVASWALGAPSEELDSHIYKLQWNMGFTLFAFTIASQLFEEV